MIRINVQSGSSLQRIGQVNQLDHMAFRIKGPVVVPAFLLRGTKKLATDKGDSDHDTVSFSRWNQIADFLNLGMSLRATMQDNEERVLAVGHGGRWRINPGWMFLNGLGRRVPSRHCRIGRDGSNGNNE